MVNIVKSIATYLLYSGGKEFTGVDLNPNRSTTMVVKAGRKGEKASTDGSGDFTHI